jgi:hypothetical protein
LLLLGAIFWLISGERRHARPGSFDIRGAVLSTGGMLLLVYALVKAPDQGWGTARTLGEFAGAFGLLAAFVINEQHSKNPLVPLSIFRVKGLAAADVTQLIALAGFLSMFFFLTLYMQNVLGYSPIKAGAAYLPLTAGVAVSAGISSQLLARIGTRPVIVVGALIAAGGLYYLSRVPVGGSYLTDLFPGLMVVSVGLGAVFVAVTTAANADVDPGRPAWPRRCSTPPSRSAARSVSRSSPRPRPPAPAICWPPAPPVRGAHLRLPPGTAGRQHLRGRHRGHRAATSNTRGEAHQAVPEPLPEPAKPARPARR